MDTASVGDHTEGDWGGARRALLELRSLISDERLDRSLAALDRGDESTFVELIASGDIWNHMGSLFDQSFDERDKDARFVRAQLQLADALEHLGVATDDVVHHAMLLRGQAAPGWRRID